MSEESTPHNKDIDRKCQSYVPRARFKYSGPSLCPWLIQIFGPQPVPWPIQIFGPQPVPPWHITVQDSGPAACPMDNSKIRVTQPVSMAYLKIRSPAGPMADLKMQAPACPMAYSNIRAPACPPWQIKRFGPQLVPWMILRFGHQTVPNGWFKDLGSRLYSVANSLFGLRRLTSFGYRATSLVLSNIPSPQVFSWTVYAQIKGSVFEPFGQRGGGVSFDFIRL